MAAKRPAWTKGRGRLGVLTPVIGKWKAKAESPMGPVACSRVFARVLGDNYVQLTAVWDFAGKSYEENALFGAGDEGELAFWSFTSDGKHSTGKLTGVADVHPEAFGFEAQMPAGLARMIYWPDETEGFHWAVEAKTKKGWSRFTEHHYRKA
ncbi:MAG: hypothetical protein ABJD11_10825 [Gemmatimonadota bacterium]